MVATLETEEQSIEVDASEPAKQPIAIVGGEALDDLPDDLYIPPQALQVFLESFQGLPASL